MTNIQLKVMGATAVATVDGKITSGMVGLPVSIEYDESWVGLSRTAFFRVGSQVRKRTGVSDSTTVPWEILRNHSKPLEIGIEGRNSSGDIVIPTVWATVGTIKEGASGDILAAPLPNKEPAQGGGAIDDSIISYENTWSSKNTVDKLCPSFTESGSIVSCEPVEGYPLAVQTNGASKVYRCGKNLVNQAIIGSGQNNGITFEYLHNEDCYCLNGTHDASTSNSQLMSPYFVLPTVKGQYYTGKVEYISGTVSGDTGRVFFGESDVVGSRSNWFSVKLANSDSQSASICNKNYCTAVWLFGYAGVSFDNYKIRIQLEPGSTATDYEKFKEVSEFTPGEEIPALDGVNTVWADSGDVTVTGKVSPQALYNKVKELSAAMTAMVGV